MLNRVGRLAMHARNKLQQERAARDSEKISVEKQIFPLTKINRYSLEYTRSNIVYGCAN
jgi:hypothetical protein